MIERFHQTSGFTYPQILPCFATTLSSLTLVEALLHGFDMFSGMIGNGEFDRVLLHPMGSIYQVLYSKSKLAHVERLLQTIIILTYAILRSQVGWTGRRVVILVIMIAGGTTAFAGIFIICTSLCFFTLGGLEFMNMFTDRAREYGKYPIDIYGKTVLIVYTCLIPFTLFQYCPFLCLVGISHDWWYAYLPFVVFLFLIPNLILWRLGMRRYQSTGS